MGRGKGEGKRGGAREGAHSMGIGYVRPVRYLVDAAAVLHRYRVAYVCEFPVLCAVFVLLLPLASVLYVCHSCLCTVCPGV